MPHERFQEALRELGVLYSKTKKYVLNAEQVDPDASSNIPAIGEHRYALDHVMRALSEYFEKGSEADEDYLCAQIENARGHMFRAAYDALDGAGISYKFRIDNAMRGLSNDAIAAVHPDYYEKDLPEIYALEEKIAEHRDKKDEQNRTMQDLDDYCATVDRINEISTVIISKVPAFKQWQRRNSKSNLVWKIALPILLIVVSVILTRVVTRWSDHSSPRPNHTNMSPTPTATPSPSPVQAPP